MGFSSAVKKRMLASGWSMPYALLAEHWLNMLYEQALAVIPITLMLVATVGIFFGRNASNPGELTWGLICAIVGLTLFVDALRMAVMPLGELLGEKLPARLPMPVVLFIACCLGILCTYAEPAIASLRPLARLVDKSRTPYLHLMLNELQEPMVFAIGLGVGIAAVLGILRFVKGWSLKPLIYATLTPALICACWMEWGNPDLKPLIGLAWDCGGVTTGPVTVPILLALGIGVMKTTREKEKAKSMLAAAIKSGGQQPSLDGFGIVTLASILPVLCVELMAIVVSFVYSKEDIINAAPKSELESAADTSPLREVVFAIRAILPLNVALVLIVLFVVKAPMPLITVFLPEDVSEKEVAAAEGSEGVDGQTPTMDAEQGTPAQGNAGAVASAGKPADELDASSSPAPAPAISASNTSFYKQYFPHGAGGLVLGVLIAQVGQILFNLGLTFGFTSIGDSTGQVLPAAFLSIPSEAGSPYYSYSGGVAITLVCVFLLGFLATRAEPALNVLGSTVEKLSHGSFTRKALVYTVCVGVASGMCIGASKILFGVPILAILLIKYGIALLLTLEAGEDFTNIGWDSAGVTTGPVTVPFVLSLGIGFNKATNSPEGFGILTAASVAPIITVLAADLLRRTLRRAKRSKAGVVPATSVSSTSEAGPSVGQ